MNEMGEISIKTNEGGTVLVIKISAPNRLSVREIMVALVDVAEKIRDPKNLIKTPEGNLKVLNA